MRVGEFKEEVRKKGLGKGWMGGGWGGESDGKGRWGGVRRWIKGWGRGDGKVGVIEVGE